MLTSLVFRYNLNLSNPQLIANHRTYRRLFSLSQDRTTFLFKFPRSSIEQKGDIYMLKKKTNLLLTVLFLVVTAEISVLVLLGQTNMEITNETIKMSSTPVKTKEDSSELKKTFPVVEYSSEPLSEDEREKSKKYDKGIQVLFSDISKNEETLSTLHWAKDLTALPIEKSDVVILGKVVNAKAHLSAAKKLVFSEFKIEIKNIFKNTSQQKFKNEDYIKVEREGGVVRYPSGYTIWHQVAGQQMPIVGGRYLFFLTNNFPIYGYYKQDFYILTAYKLKEGKVFPLDNPDDSHPIVFTYEDKEEIVLLNDLQNALKSH